MEKNLAPSSKKPPTPPNWNAQYIFLSPLERFHLLYFAGFYEQQTILSI